MYKRVTVVSLSVCLCVTNLAPAYDVCATNWTYQPGLLLTPKVFNLQIPLKSFLSRVIASFSPLHRQGGHFQSLKLPCCQFNWRPLPTSINTQTQHSRLCTYMYVRSTCIKICTWLFAYYGTYACTSIEWTSACIIVRSLMLSARVCEGCSNRFVWLTFVCPDSSASLGRVCNELNLHVHVWLATGTRQACIVL